MAYFRPIPNLTIASPMNEHELRCLMYTAQLPDKGPFVIRYPRGRGVLTDWRCPLQEIEIGKGRRLKEGEQLAVLTIGPIGNTVAQAIAHAEEKLNAQNRQPISIAHYDLRFLKPLDEELLHEVGKRYKQIITVEDGVRTGGMGSAVLEFMSDHHYTPQLTRLGVPDQFVEHGAVQELYKICQIDEKSIEQTILQVMNRV